MRFFVVALFMTLLSACRSGLMAPEKPEPSAEPRQQTCQPGTALSQNDCGHFPEPEFH
ncbi:hypothetical protein EIO60_00020|nr:hypothetical protein [Candidatus Pantoea persica]